MFRRLLLVVVVAVVLLSPSALLADTTYTYTGNPFTSLSGNPAATSIQVSFTLSAPLPANLPLFSSSAVISASLVSFTITDGVTTLGVNNQILQFLVGTDAQGNIISWAIIVVNGSGTGLETINCPNCKTPEVVDDSLLNGNENFNQNSPGTWNVPEPSSLSLLLIGLSGVAGAGVISRKFQA